MKRTARTIWALSFLLTTGSVRTGAASEPAAPAPPALPEKDRDKKKDEVLNQEDHTVRILRTSNKAQVNRYVPKAYVLRNVNPFAVVRFFRRVMEIEEGAWFTFKHPREDRGIVLLICPAYQIPYLDALMAQIDRAGLTSSAGSKDVYYRMKHRDVRDPDFAAAFQNYGTGFGDFIPDVETNSIYLKEAPSSSDNILLGLDVMDKPRAQVRVEASLYEVDIDDDATLGLDFHAWKNGPGRNLFAAGAFYERGKISRLSGPGATPVIDPGPGTAGLPGRRFRAKGRNAAYLLDVPSAFFDFLAVKGKARVLTRTNLSVLNTETARIRAGDEILYYHVQTTSVPNAGIRPAGLPLDPFGAGDAVDPSTTQVGETRTTGTATILGQPSPVDITTQTFTIVPGVGSDRFPDNRTVTGKTVPRTLEAVDTGVFLEVRPIIGRKEGEEMRPVRLKADYAVVNLIGFQDDGLPILDNRDLSAEVELREGEEAVLGGLVRERRVKATRKVPLLGSIPILGYLFGGEITQIQRSLVVVTLAPRVDGAGAVTPDDAGLKMRAEGGSAPLPARRTFFDQYLLDRE